MANLFNSTNYATREPTIEELGTPIVAGDYLAWKRTDLYTDYPPASYSLSYSARLNSAGTVLNLNATESGNDYLIEYDSSDTLNIAIGIYHWSAYITKTSDSNRLQVDYGQWEVVSNLATDSSDPRSHNQKVLDAIQAVIENRATQDQSSYSIAGRSLSRMDPDSLFRFEGIYKSRVQQELRDLRIKQGLGNKSIILSRLPSNN